MQNYMKEILGVSAEVKKIEAPAGLPLYMTAGRTFFRVDLTGMPFLLIEIPEQDRFGVVALEKQLVKYMNCCKMNVAYMLSGVTKVQRKALIERRIPFVVFPHQIFLPFLGILLSDCFMKQKKTQINMFTPASQCLFLYFLYNSSVCSILKKDAAEALGITRTSITRASNQLLEMGLLSEKAVGKEIRMSPTERGRAYYELGKPYLINPVSRVIMIEDNHRLSGYPASGETGLSQVSMLNAPGIPVVAIGNNDPVISGLKEADEKWETDCALLQVEIWKYDPGLFSQGKIVDPVSMAVSLRENEDERVQGELKEYMEGLQW